MNAPVNHEVRKHARLSASRMDRVMSCPGSYRLEEKMPYEPAGEAAAIGTAIHELSERILRGEAVNPKGHPDDHFDMANSVDDQGGVDHAHFNQLHRYFEDLQGGSGHISDYYWRADNETRWHIRQLNLLCHEFESWQLSWRKKHTAPEWQRPSQLMCWLSAPRFALEENDYELFGIDTINRSLGGVYVGVNKAVGKHHWEVFQDEGRDSRIEELTTSSLKTQTEAAGDFDIEWANNPGTFPWQIKQLAEFREWLTANDIDPEDKTLTIGHPQIGQVDLLRSFGTEDYREIWRQLNTHLDVHAVRTSKANAVYEYCWSDSDYVEKQMEFLQ